MHENSRYTPNKKGTPGPCPDRPLFTKGAHVRTVRPLKDFDGICQNSEVVSGRMQIMPNRLDTPIKVKEWAGSDYSHLFWNVKNEPTGETKRIWQGALVKVEPVKEEKKEEPEPEISGPPIPEMDLSGHEAYSSEPDDGRPWENHPDYQPIEPDPSSTIEPDPDYDPYPSEWPPEES
jgi:hypothetical protein